MRWRRRRWRFTYSICTFLLLTQSNTQSLVSLTWVIIYTISHTYESNHLLTDSLTHSYHLMSRIRITLEENKNLFFQLDDIFFYVLISHFTYLLSNHLLTYSPTHSLTGKENKNCNEHRGTTISSTSENYLSRVPSNFAIELHGDVWLLWEFCILVPIFTDKKLKQSLGQWKSTSIQRWIISAAWFRLRQFFYNFVCPEKYGTSPRILHSSIDSCKRRDVSFRIAVSWALWIPIDLACGVYFSSSSNSSSSDSLSSNSDNEMNSLNFMSPECNSL